jgi:hypothetical protein
MLAVGTGDIWLFLGTDDPYLTVWGDTVLLLPGKVLEKLPCLGVVLCGILSRFLSGCVSVGGVGGVEDWLCVGKDGGEYLFTGVASFFDAG